MSLPEVFCILRTSKSYNYHHVMNLAAQLTDARLTVVGDCKHADISLQYDWPGWWAKLELCRPDIKGDIFYMDLDTVVLGPIRSFAQQARTTFLSDFYRSHMLQSSVMFLTEQDRARIWAAWIKDPQGHIARFSALRPGFNGDQNFMQEVLGPDVARWQDNDFTPVCSYKTDVLRNGHRPRNGLVIFHGSPRPWEITPEQMSWLRSGIAA